MPESIELAAGGGRTEEWRAELERQATPEVRERLYRAARRRLRMFAGRARHVNDADVDDVVMGVLVDTLDGRLAWTPARKSLEQHLLDAIAYRVRDQARSRRRRMYEAYDEDATGEPLAGRAHEDAGDAHDLRAIADQVVPELVARAEGDPEVTALIELYRDGVTKRREVIRESGMTAAHYDNAVRRLRRLTRHVPEPALDAALHVLTGLEEVP